MCSFTFLPEFLRHGHIHCLTRLTSLHCEADVISCAGKSMLPSVEVYSSLLPHVSAPLPPSLLLGLQRKSCLLVVTAGADQVTL